MHWARTQQLVSLSSAEAELNAAVKAACEGLGFANMVREVGGEVIVKLFGDSSANDGILHRAGAGKVKHLSVRQLWLQERIAHKEIDHFKIPRAQNHSDVLTHHWTRAEGEDHFGKLNCHRPGPLEQGKPIRACASLSSWSSSYSSGANSGLFHPRGGPSRNSTLCYV